MDKKAKTEGALIGALVADSATLGLHWLYDFDQTVKLGGDKPEFYPSKPSDYEGDFPGYFAHPNKKPGELTQYGAQLLTILKCIDDQDGVFDVLCYQESFQEAFDRGGWFNGYIDAATRGTLDNIRDAKAKLEQGQALETANHGADDDQIPAFAKVPAVVAHFLEDDQMLAYVAEAVRVTNNNDEAVMYCLYAAQALAHVLKGESITDALEKAYETTDLSDDAKEKIGTALKTSSDKTPDYFGKKFGTPCHCHQAIPLSVALLKTATDYKDGVRKNIQATGDNAGRSIFVGAMLGAAHGLGGEEGIPLKWLSKLTNKEQILSII